VTREQRFQAAIFDMDGVLTDSEPRYHRAINAVLAEEGLQLSDDQYREVIGLGVEVTWEALISRHNLQEPISAYLRRYDEAVLRELRRPAQPDPGARELIAAARQRGLRIGLASSSLRFWIEALLEGMGLADAFDAIVWQEMAERPKPAPDLYLVAAEMLAVLPQFCLAIEDTPAGIAAAKAAGMFTVQVRSASTAFPPLPEADLVVDSLLSLNLGSLLKDGS